jgi:hypothetical protein
MKDSLSQFRFFYYSAYATVSDHLPSQWQEQSTILAKRCLPKSIVINRGSSFFFESRTWTTCYVFPHFCGSFPFVVQQKMLVFFRGSFKLLIWNSTVFFCSKRRWRFSSCLILHSMTFHCAEYCLMQCNLFFGTNSSNCIGWMDWW